MKLKYENLADNLRQDILNGNLKPGQRMKTEFELAQLYGVSRQTVRSALNILESEGFVFRRRGSGTYVNRPSADESRTMRIGVIVTNICDFIFPAILRGIDEILAANSYSMVLKCTQNRIDNECKILNSFLNDPIDGLIIEGTKTALPNPNIALFEEFTRRGIPIVFINSFPKRLPNPHYVIMDDHQGGMSAVQYLHQLGHRNIVGVFKSDDIQGIGRYSGFVDGIAQNNLPLSDDRLLWYNTENKRLLPEYLNDKFQSEPCASATAVVCYNDEAALQVVQALSHSGNTSLNTMVCFDQVIYTEAFPGKIVALAHPKEIMGQKAASMLLSIIHGNEEQSATLSWNFDS